MQYHCSNRLEAQNQNKAVILLGGQPNRASKHPALTRFSWSVQLAWLCSWSELLEIQYGQLNGQQTSFRRATAATAGAATTAMRAHAAAMVVLTTTILEPATPCLWKKNESLARRRGSKGQGMQANQACLRQSRLPQEGTIVLCWYLWREGRICGQLGCRASSN